MSDKLKRLFIPGIVDALLPTVEWVQKLLGANGVVNTALS